MGKFILKQAVTGPMFDLKAANGEIIATSQIYSSDGACRKGIESVKENSVVAQLEDQTVEGFEEKKNPKFEVYKDVAEEFRFRLKAANGEIIASGQGYKEKAGCLNGIESIRHNAPDAEIVTE